jgi:hypothetical protein
MSINQRPKTAYGLSQPNFATSPMPIVTTRAPLSSDMSEIGTIWVNTATNNIWALTSVVNNIASWQPLGIVDYGTATNGELLIGATGSIPAWASLTSTDGSITYTVGAHSLDLKANASAGPSWTVVTGNTGTLAANNAYLINNATPAHLTTMTLPAVCAVGSTIEVAVYTYGGVYIAQNASQYIVMGSSISKAGTTGYLTSTGYYYASVKLLCVAANTVFQVINSQSRWNLGVEGAS